MATTFSPGKAVRRVLGDRLSRVAGHYYRAAFVDLHAVARAFAEAIPAGAHVLDVGGGDGEPLNYLLALRADLRVTLIDPAADTGRWLDEQHRGRVQVHAQTSLRDFIARADAMPDVVVLSDVVHHVPPPARAALFADIAAMVNHRASLRLLIKDVEPVGARAWLGAWADRNITGDRQVAPIGRTELRALVDTSIGPNVATETALFGQDAPNYAIVFRFDQSRH